MERSTQEHASAVSKLTQSYSAEAFELMHCAILGSLAVSLPSSLIVDAAFLAESLTRLLTSSVQHCHILLKKAATAALKFWTGKACNKFGNRFQQRSADVLVPHLFLLEQ